MEDFEQSKKGNFGIFQNRLGNSRGVWGYAPIVNTGVLVRYDSVVLYR
jgi:hypothetical protein